jgi:hypothetical protein
LKAPGAACTPGLFECAIASWCSANHVCTNVGAFEGEPCGPQQGGETIACTDGTSCEMNGVGNSFCVSPPKAGEACVEDLECGGHVTGYCGFDFDAGASRCVSCPP